MFIIMNYGTNVAYFKKDTLKIYIRRQNFVLHISLKNCFLNENVMFKGTFSQKRFWDYPFKS
jgi:hypothetical protein